MTDALRLVLVFPVRNEAAVLERSVRSAVAVLDRAAPNAWQLIIASNNSTDQTNAIGERLSRENPRVVLRTSDVPGKGQAIRDAWQSTTADTYAFSDVDLSVDLGEALPRMMNAINNGAHIATGSRVLPTSYVERPALRRFISKGYRLIARVITGTRLSDLPCGCKMIAPSVVRDLVPAVKNGTWFFDSELLLRAERIGLRITEVPVHWVEQRYPERARAIPIARVSAQYLEALLRFRFQK